MQRAPLFLLMILLAAAALILLRPGASSSAQDRDAIAAVSSAAHPAGTDALGRDRLVRVAAAMLLGLAGATAAAAVTTVIAAIVGTLAAFAPSALGGVLLLVSDTFLALPWLFLLMMVRSGLPLSTSPAQSATITFLLLALLGWSTCARAVHVGAVAVCGAGWMVQGRAAGLRVSRLLGRHALPHMLPLLIPQFLIAIPACLVAEANLGTLGLGVSEPLPSWGSMLLELDNSALLATSRWVYLPIALLITLLVLLELLATEA